MRQRLEEAAVYAAKYGFDIMLVPDAFVVFKGDKSKRVSFLDVELGYVNTLVLVMEMLAKE